MMEDQREGRVEECPWVLFAVADGTYAVNSARVLSIAILPKIVEIPNSEEFVRGIVHFRGSIILAVDIRSLFFKKNKPQERKEFCQMLEKSRDSHIKWVNTFKDCLYEDKKFTLATDPHKCVFGMWYDQYKPLNDKVKFHMDKIREPHNKLHRMAEKAVKELENLDLLNRDAVKTRLISEAETYVQEILSLLGTSEEVVEHNNQDMLIVLEQGERIIGIVVDEVLGVEQLSESYASFHLDQVYRFDLIQGIASRQGESNPVLKLDYGRLFEMCSCVTVSEEDKCRAAKL